jgi:thiol:disulfide interchange protein DsbD
MKKLLITLVSICSLAVANAQILQPAHWSTSTSASETKLGDEIDLIFFVKIDDGWHLYSSEFLCEDGPIKTSFTFNEDKSYQLVGDVKPINPKDKHEEAFDCDVKVFYKSAEFRQRVKVLASPINITGTYDFQVCTNIDGSCTPGSEDFSFTKLKITGTPATQNKIEVSKVEKIKTAPIDTTKKEVKEEVRYSKNKGPFLDKAILEGEPTIDEESFFGYLLFAFILGLTSIITPCVFPMLPMTVTFFLRDNQTKKQGLRKALIFGLSIIVIYTLAGTIFAVLLGTEGLNTLATHWAPNLLIFVLFIFFALSFFGLFEINAPHQLVNKADQQAEKGGLIGIFFMAATLVLVSFSCTVPIVGNVLFMSAGGQILKPVLAMFSYALAFAMPFTLFAAFPEWIKSLPKSGGWLSSVKVTLGFLELALCLKFFSIADQAYHWGLLDREINIALWIVIFSMMGFYFLGKLKISNDAPVESISVPRLLLAVVTFSFVVYITPGMWGAPLKMLAGYLPPVHTLDFDLVALAKSKNENESCAEPKYADFLHLPQGLKGYFDYDQALACAREQNKPLFIDFTGHGCTNCREMEAVVWSDPSVLQRLNNDFVIVALYVDDKTELPEAEWITSSYDGKVKKTIGKKNADIQIATLENNAQPFYVLLGKDEKVLAWPYAYNRDPQKFVDFLERGKKKFKELY